MLTKILFTIIVVITVMIFFRHKQMQNLAARARPAKKPQAVKKPSSSLSVQTVAYLMIAILVAISVMIFIFSRDSANRIVNIRVINTDGSMTNYQARHKTIEGRKFTTLDGRQVTLSESDRVEMIEGPPE